MEILLTVVITLMFVALIGAGINLITLNKRVNEMEDSINIIEREIEDGDSVEFDVGEGPKGPNAINVSKTSSEEE